MSCAYYFVQDQGNDALKRGLQLKKKFYLREALNLYTKGLEMGSTLPELLSVLHSNRAQAHLLLENYRRALEDSLAATGLQGTNLKVTQTPCTIHVHKCKGKLLLIWSLGIRDCTHTLYACKLAACQYGAPAVS